MSAPVVHPEKCPIPTSLLHSHGQQSLKWCKVLREAYQHNLQIMKFYLDDCRIYIEHHYMRDNESEINYHNWFLFESIQAILHNLEETLLNSRWLDRYLLHPFNILLYY